MENNLFISNKDLKDNPFYNKRVAYTGSFALDNKTLSKLLKHWGADVNNTISRATKFVLIGNNPNPEKISKLDTLLHDGFSIRRLSQDDLDCIFQGENWEDYTTTDEVIKDLDFTIDHFNQHHYTFDEGTRNKIAGKELYFCEGFREDKYAISQIAGNLAAWCNHMLSSQIQIFVLSNSTIEKLKRGEKDENILMIQNYYNRNKADKFDFSFITEDDILNFAKLWIETYDDPVLNSLLQRYLKSNYAQ